MLLAKTTGSFNIVKCPLFLGTESVTEMIYLLLEHINMYL